MKVFASEYVKSKFNGKKAALASYNVKGEVQARKMAWENLQKPMVQSLVEKELDKAGLTTDYTDLKLRKLIEAAEKNIEQTKPETMVAAIRLINELRNRFPASRNIIANIDLNKLYEDKSVDDLSADLKAQQKLNKRLLDTLKELKH